jgi:hypothetical protein
MPARAGAAGAGYAGRMPGTALPLTGRPSGSKGGSGGADPRHAEPLLPPTFVCVGDPLVHMAATETWRWHRSTASLPEMVAAGGERVATRRTRLWHGVALASMVFSVITWLTGATA